MEVIPSSSHWLLWLILSLFALLARAHSVVPEPLTYLEFVTSPSIEILPRDRFNTFKQPSLTRRDIETDYSLRHDDSLRIQFIAFNRTFSIHLEPNLDLFHPEATITIHHSNNTKTTTRLRPEDNRLYKGVVLDNDSTDNRLNEDIVGLERVSLSEELSYSSGVLGWARVQIHDDGGVSPYCKNDRYPTFEGTFSLYNELYHIKSIENFKISQFQEDPEIPNPSARHHIHRSATMVIYRDSDIKNSYKKRSLSDESSVGSCAMDDIVSSENRRRYRTRSLDDQHLGRLSPWWNSLRIGDHKLTKRDVVGCPTARKIAFMGAVADCTYVTSYNSPDNARKQILQDWGTASVVYEKTFNVTLGLIKMEILDQTCPNQINDTMKFNRACDESYTINQRLSDFSEWRGKSPDDGASLWHLMSKCNTGTKVGVAWLSQLCTTKANFQPQDNAFVSGTGVSTIVKDEWKVVAHEIGHGFGATHDCTADSCPCSKCDCCPLSDTACDAGGKFIMNPKNDVATDQFSPCTVSEVCRELMNIGSCLQDPGSSTKILSQSMCGNGLKEDNEQCDCGSECDDDPCCDTNCSFKAGAVCADKNDMCCKGCQYKPANEVCRPASSNCDIPEVCNGTSGACPIDKHVEDGTTCAANLACAGGQCTSRDNQCLLRGSRLGIKKACPSLADQSCNISCANPNDTNSCLQMSGFFVDGTPCGFGGKCKKGKCDTSSIGNSLSSWIEQNKKIIIPIASILGALLLCCIIQCVYRCVKKKKHSVSTKHRLSSNSDNNYNHNSYNNYPSRSGNKWVDPTPYNGYNEPSRRFAPSYGNERSMPMPSPTHQQQRSDYAYAGTGPIYPLPSETSQRPPMSPRSRPRPRPEESLRDHYVDDTKYNGPRTNDDRQYTQYRHQHY